MMGAVAGVVELVDTPDLGSGGASRGGSSPSTRTNCLEFFTQLGQVAMVKTF